MFKKVSSVLLLSFVVCLFTSACTVTVSDSKTPPSYRPETEAEAATEEEVVFKEVDIPDCEWQLDNEGITDEDHPRMKAYKALLSVSDQY